MSREVVYRELREHGEKLGSVLEALHQYGGKQGKCDATSRELIFQQGKLKLYHYLAEKPASGSVPILIVYALVNRPTILDLQSGHSAVEKMLENGLDVYLIDWGYPDKSDRHLGLDNYINKQMHACVECVCERHQQQSVNLLGVCQGGVLSLCYSSLHAEKVKNLVLMVTPVDFQTHDDCLSQWLQNIDIDLMVETLGNIPGSMLSNTFLALKPGQLQLKKYLDLIDTIGNASDHCERVANFMAMEEWIVDSPDQAGQAFREYIKGCYQNNQLLRGELEVNGEKVDLGNLQMPVLNVYARRDHIVPPAASQALRPVLAGRDYEELVVEGGHIGIFVSQKSLGYLFPRIAAWLIGRFPN